MFSPLVPEQKTSESWFLLMSDFFSCLHHTCCCAKQEEPFLSFCRIIIISQFSSHSLLSSPASVVCEMLVLLLLVSVGSGSRLLLSSLDSRHPTTDRRWEKETHSSPSPVQIISSPHLIPEGNLIFKSNIIYMPSAPLTTDKLRMSRKKRERNT